MLLAVNLAEIFNPLILPLPQCRNLLVPQGLIELRNLSYALIKSANQACPFRPPSPFMEGVTIASKKEKQAMNRGGGGPFIHLSIF